MLLTKNILNRVGWWIKNDFCLWQYMNGPEMLELVWVAVDSVRYPVVAKSAHLLPPK